VSSGRVRANGALYFSSPQQALKARRRILQKTVVPHPEDGGASSRSQLALIAPAPQRNPEAGRAGTVDAQADRMIQSSNRSRSIGTLFEKAAAVARERSNALKGSLKNDVDKKYDGLFVGAGGKTYPPDAPLSSIPAVTPRKGRGRGTAIFVNGLPFDKAVQANSMQAIANKSGMNVVGVHNSTEGIGRDLVQALGDKLNVGKNPAVVTLAKMMKKELDAGRPVHVMGHSQGGLIIARALQRVEGQLRREGMSPAQVEKTLSHVKVETFGAAASRFPNGPRYVHYVNRADVLPVTFGLGPVKGNPAVQPGKGAEMRFFYEAGGPGLSPGHDFDTIYLDHRVPFARK
jgi:hypothetical protein